MGVRVLLIEDDETIAEPLADGLRHFGLTVHHVANGADGLRGPHGDVVLLDLGLPDMDGIDVCRGIRRTSDVPIIILSARGEEADRVLGLELGADDYLAKPFSIRELVARIRAVSRRHQRPGGGGIVAGVVVAESGVEVEPYAQRVLSAQELAAQERSAAGFGVGAGSSVGVGVGVGNGFGAGSDFAAGDDFGAEGPGRVGGVGGVRGAGGGTGVGAGGGGAEYDWSAAYETPAQGTPAQGTPAHGTSVSGTPAHGTPVSGTPTHGTPMYGTPAHGTPAFGNPAFENPTYGSPAYGSPAHGTPTYGTPAHGVPVYEPPVHEPPVYEPPAYEQAPPEPRDSSGPAAAGDSAAPPPGPLVVDRRTRQVWVGEVPVALTPKEFELLALLTEDPGAVYSRQQILNRVWDDHYQGPTKTLDVHVATLRRKLGDPAWIQTLRGVGFRLAVRTPGQAPGPGPGRPQGHGRERGQAAGRHRTPEARAS